MASSASGGATPHPTPGTDARSSSVSTDGQHYSLKWNNHQNHVLSAFDQLLQNDQLVDCTLVCEDGNIKAHKVVLSACSPYFQKIFCENPCKHPILVLKDITGWQIQSIVDFMYKGETSVPEHQLGSLIKAAESLKVRGLTSHEQSSSRIPGRHTADHMPSGPQIQAHSMNGYHSMPPSHLGAPRDYSSSPARSGYHPQNLGAPNHMDVDHPHSKVQDMSHSNQSSPMSLTNHGDDRDRSHHANRSSPGPAGSGPRRKQARPRRRSGDSIGGASIDLSKAESPTFASGAGSASGSSGSFGGKDNSPSSSTHHNDDAAPENLSMKRPSVSPAINLVKTEQLLEERKSRSATDQPDHPGARPHHSREREAPPNTPSPFFGASGRLHHLQEHEARVEALQALNFMAQGGGLPPHFPPPGHHPLAGHHPPPPHNGLPHRSAITPSPLANLAAASAVVAGRPTSTPSTPSNAFADEFKDIKTNFEFQRISIDRSKMSEEEAFEHAIEMIQTRQMGFRKAADFFSVSKWKLYKTARKRGIYAEIKKQNAAQQALTKVPSNVQHFADMGVYKQLKKKTHLTKDVLFPHLPGVTEGEERKVYKASSNNNNTPGSGPLVANNNNNNNNSPYATMAEHFQKKMGFPPPPMHPLAPLLPNLPHPAQNNHPLPNSGAPTNLTRASQGEEEPISDDEDMDENIDIVDADSSDAIPKPDLRVPSGMANEDEEDEERVLVINHSADSSGSGHDGDDAASPDGMEEEDSGREDSA